MIMKIKVLGCSNSWTERYTSCYLVNDNILMDCGCDAYKAYLKTGKSLNDIKLFLITHFHADHIFGLNVFLTNIHRNLDKLKFKPIIVGGKGIKEACHLVFQASNLINFDFSDYIDFIEVDDGSEICFENIKITACKLDHGDVVDFGYILKENGKTFGYSGDSTLVAQLYDFIEKCDSVILNVSRMATNPKHLGFNDFKMLTEKYPNKTILAGHCDEDVYNVPFLADKRVEEGMVIEF